MFAVLLFLIGILSRIVFHTPNFTPIISLALFSGAFFPKRYAVWFPVMLMILSDLIIGLHSTIVFTWGGVALIALLGKNLQKNTNLFRVCGFSLWAALLYFGVTNLAVWLLDGLYPQTLAGLKECFIMAIPFFRSTLVSSLVYSVIIFGAYEFCTARLKKTRWANALLMS